MKQDDGLALSSHTFQGQIFDIRLTSTAGGRTLFDGSFHDANHMEVKDCGYDRIIGGTVLHFKPSALFRRSAGNSQVSVNQFEKRKSTDIN